MNMTTEFLLDEMKQRGAKYLVLCPFHKEKTPSMQLDLEDLEYFCYSCEAKGRLKNVKKVIAIDFVPNKPVVRLERPVIEMREPYMPFLEKLIDNL